MTPEDPPFPAAPAMSGLPPRVLILRAAYHRAVVEGLAEGARRVLAEVEAKVETVDVAGALELPAAVQFTCAGGSGFDAFVVLGCVVRGGTDHYHWVCETAMQGLMRVTLDHRLALGNGLLTLDTLAQAEARSRNDGANKGAEAAVAALTQVNVMRRYVYYRETL